MMMLLMRQDVSCVHDSPAAVHGGVGHLAAQDFLGGLGLGPPLRTQSRAEQSTAQPLHTTEGEVKGAALRCAVLLSSHLLGLARQQHLGVHLRRALVQRHRQEPLVGLCEEGRKEGGGRSQSVRSTSEHEGERKHRGQQQGAGGQSPPPSLPLSLPPALSG